MRATVKDFASANEQHRGQRRKPRRGVNRCPTCKVEHAPCGEQSAAPNHVCYGKIYKQHPQGQEDHIRAKLHAVGERARDQGGRDDGEHHLVCNEDEQWNIIVDG